MFLTNFNLLTTPKLRSSQVDLLVRQFWQGGITMSVMLGNLSVEQIEKRLGIEFPEDIKNFMKGTQQANAKNIAKGKWHCFDMPFNIVCGDMETATKIYEGLKPQSDKCKEALQFSLDTKN